MGSELGPAAHLTDMNQYSTDAVGRTRHQHDDEKRVLAVIERAVKRVMRWEALDSTTLHHESGCENTGQDGMGCNCGAYETALDLRAQHAVDVAMRDLKDQRNGTSGDASPAEGSAERRRAASHEALTDAALRGDLRSEMLPLVERLGQGPFEWEKARHDGEWAAVWPESQRDNPFGVVLTGDDEHVAAVCALLNLVYASRNAVVGREGTR